MCLRLSWQSHVHENGAQVMLQACRMQQYYEQKLNRVNHHMAL